MTTEHTAGPMEQWTVAMERWEALVERWEEDRREQDAAHARTLALCEELAAALEKAPVRCFGEGRCAHMTRTVADICSGCRFGDERRTALAHYREAQEEE